MRNGKIIAVTGTNGKTTTVKLIAKALELAGKKVFLGGNIGTPFIDAFKLDDDFDFSVLKNYENYCDLFLFDSKSELPGGTGKSFNWENLKKYKLKKEFFISGGIGLHSIESLIELFKMDLPIYGVDVNSKFEDENYLKKIDELKTFIETIKYEIYSR